MHLFSEKTIKINLNILKTSKVSFFINSFFKEAMVGDINFFLTEEEDGMTGEINMMIAGRQKLQSHRL